MIEGSSDFSVSAHPTDLSSNDTVVWLVNQNQSAARVEEFFHTLSTDEQERARRFCFEKDRNHFIVARGVLRYLSGVFLETTPNKIRFKCGEHGKPSLSNEFSSTNLKFNVSHSGGSALFAFSRGRELGVDIERIQPKSATEEIWKLHFSLAEIEMLRSLPGSIRVDAFFDCWTRKEAYIKAIGEGLSCPLDSFDVTVAPGDPARLIETRAHALAPSHWTMRSLDVGPDYKAALVVQGSDWKLQCWRWDEADGSA
jgi:4'-phosphopantetheinyl transferase